MRTPVIVRGLALLVAGIVASAAVVAGTTVSAAACTPGQRYDEATQTTYYENCQGQQGDDDEDSASDNGDGGASQPTCEFSGSWDEFCRGTKPCYSFDPAHLQNEEAAREANDSGLSERPSEDDHLIFVSCLGADGEREDLYYWSSEFDEGVSTRDRLLAAVGALVLPQVTPTFNPPERSLVNLDTWWWAEGASADPIVGSEALGLVAIAEPRSMVVTAGGRSVTCPVVESRSDECVMVFRRAGDYTATMRIDYDIRFELDGGAFDVPGGNEDLLTVSSTDTVPVPVREVQSRVTDLG